MKEYVFTECVDIVGSSCKPFEGSRWYVSTGAVSTDHIEPGNVETVEFEGKPSRANLTVESGDVLFAKMQGTKKILLIDERLADHIYSTGFCAVRAKAGILTTECLYHLVASDAFLKQKDKYCSGATQKAITNAGLEKIILKVPSIDEQNLIAKELGIISTIINMRQEEIEQLNRLIKARFVEMFGDPLTNSKGWPVHQLSDYIEFLTSGSRGWAKHFSDKGEYFITIKNVKNCQIILDDVQHIIAPKNAEAVRTKVQEGDLLISITADLGRTGVVTKEIAEHGAYINQHLTCIRLNQKTLKPLFAAYYLESEAGKSQFRMKNQSAVKAGLNFNSINTLKVIVAPIELQSKYISFVEQTDKSKFLVIV